MRLLKVILAVVVVLFSAFLIERSCHEDGGRPDPAQPGGVAMVTQPPLYSEPPSTKSMAHIEQATPRAEADTRVAAIAPSERPKTQEDRVAAAPAATPIRTQADDADDDVHRTTRTTTARAARRTVARAKSVRKEPQWRLAARKKSKRTEIH